MRSLPIPAPAPAGSRQLAIPFESERILGLNLSERRDALTRLASLLLEAGGVATREGHDDER